MEIDQKTGEFSWIFLSYFRLPEGTPQHTPPVVRNLVTSWTIHGASGWEREGMRPWRVASQAMQLFLLHVKGPTFGYQHHFSGTIWSCWLFQVSKFWGNMVNQFKPVPICTLKNLKWMCPLLTHERIMNMMIQSYIITHTYSYIYIYHI